MRDGVKLATDVYLAGGASKPGPVVLTRLPYDKNGEYCFIDRIAAYFTQHGFHFVAQDVRGKFRSEGETLLFVNEAADGYDTIDWVAKQTWSNGRVAMWGDSYYGFTQWAAVSTGHPALRAIAPRVTGTWLGEPRIAKPGENTRPAEMEITYFYPLTHFHTNDTFSWEPSRDTSPRSDEIEAFMETVGVRSASFDQWFPHPVTLRRFPFGGVFEAPAIPVLHTIGWWDNIAPLSWDDHRQIEANHPHWQVNEYLYIDAIDHENYWLHDPHRVEERSNEVLDTILPIMLTPAVEFFDVFLKCEGSTRSIPRVRWNLANTEGMRESEAWPPAGCVSRQLHATVDGRLDANPPQAAELSWRHDPESPVSSLDPNAFAYLLYKPDEALRTEHEDVLVFNEHTVTEDRDLVGPVTLDLTVSSSGPNMDIFAWLIDIAPDGTGVRIARGNVHVVDATQESDVTIDLYEVGYRLRAGHHLQLQIASSDAPEFLVQPGNGEHPLLATEKVANTQRVRIGTDASIVLHLSLAEVTR